MPTSTEVQALISHNNCTSVRTNNWNGTGVNGWLVTGKGDFSSKSIFLPASGYGDGSNLSGAGDEGHYWSSTPNTSDAAQSLYFNESSFRGGSFLRYVGYVVRPVRGFAK